MPSVYEQRYLEAVKAYRAALKVADEAYEEMMSVYVLLIAAESESES